MTSLTVNCNETAALLGITTEALRLKRRPGGELCGLKPVSYCRTLFPRRVIERLAEGETLAEIYEKRLDGQDWGNFIMNAITDGHSENQVSA